MLLTRAQHLWAVGLDPAPGMVCDALVVPLDESLGDVCALLAAAFPRLAVVPAFGYAHVSLVAFERVTGFQPVAPPGPGLPWRLLGLEATPYSVRARVELDLTAAVTAFALAPRDAYVTLGYALGELDVGPLDDLDRVVASLDVHGRATRIEHRRSGDGHAAFAPEVVAQWPLTPPFAATPGHR